VLVLRMISGLVVWAWRLLVPGGRKKNRVAKTNFRDSGTVTFSAGPTQRIIATGCLTCNDNPCLDISIEIGSEKNIEKLKKAADWHAKAARKAVIDRDGEGVLQHMRHFRRYSGALVKTDEPFARSPQLRPNACIGCGSTCAHNDLSPSTAICFACNPVHRHSRPVWGTRDGREIPVDEMTDDHLRMSALMVRRWLLNGSRPVTDDRIRMTGHVLEECAKRGLIISDAGTWGRNV